MADDVVEDPEMYVQLVALAHDVAAAIVETPAVGLSGSTLYIASEARRWADIERPATSAALTGPAADILELLRRNWPDLCAGKTHGEKLMSENYGTWATLMRAWPMQPYANQAARFLSSGELLKGLVVELGAGVGTASGLVAPHVEGRFVCTDLASFLMRRRPPSSEFARYDFDEAGPWSEVDTFFGVNALHCAKSKPATIAELHRMLKPGGILLLAESIPVTHANGTPWPLSLSFGMFKGWWDRGGLIERDAWLNIFRDAGFRDRGYQRRVAGDFDLGGLIWGIK
jgi:SAM-dependent methyltransferase